MSPHGSTTTPHVYPKGMDEAGWRELPDDERCACIECNWRGSADALKAISHLTERIAEGETLPAGECPKCGALVNSAALRARFEAEDREAAAARELLAAAKKAAAETSVFQYGPYTGLVYMPRAVFDELEAAIARMEGGR